MSHVTHKLTSSLEGALAGGGDPATSPLYVFGPFLKLLVLSGAASVCFGASIWLAVITVITVSAMYYLVMQWVTDGSGGSGLNEEEFGSWAVKVNASITLIEYTLTFLVSIAALVTFIADRFPELNQHFAGFSNRTYLSVLITIFLGFIVNFGPKTCARVFGPATAAVLLLLWVMILTTIWQHGLHLPRLHVEAFSGDYLHFTLGGYARILALMTGIEIFANLVAAYDGSARKRSIRAFGSLLIIMGTTCLTMLVVGPVILTLSDPLNPEISVFTQTMDALLPAPLAHLGTFIGVAVLLSAAAASAQGVQNLSLGLRFRHYIPPWIAQRNRFEVASIPVWIQVAVCCLCFLLFGTEEETYLSLYAAGVFILLSLTGWAVFKRLIRERKQNKGHSLWSIAAALAAIFTSIATLIIFEERFIEGAWFYFVLVPVLYYLLGSYRRSAGEPKKIEDRLGMMISSSNLSQEKSFLYAAGISFKNILVPLNMDPSSELALAGAQSIARNYNGHIHLLTILSNQNERDKKIQENSPQDYLDDVIYDLDSAGQSASSSIVTGNVVEEVVNVAHQKQIDLICIIIRQRSRLNRLFLDNITTEIAHQNIPPMLIMRPTDDWRSTRTTFKNILVPLDGSEPAEQILPYVHEIAYKFNSTVTLLSVQEGPESDNFSSKLDLYLSQISKLLSLKGLNVKTLIRSDDPGNAILAVCKEQGIDLIMITNHSRKVKKTQEKLHLGSVSDNILQSTPCPVFLVSGIYQEHARKVSLQVL